MRPTVLLRLLVFSGSLTLHVQGGKVICGADQYPVTNINGSFSYCLKCAKCHAGYGLYPVCGQTVTHPPSNIGCKQCLNETFSGEYDSGPCHSCHQCAELEMVAAPCTSSSDRMCSGTCKKGYFFAKKVLHTCQQCSYCCFDGKDEEQPECIKQGLNATGRYCSVRPDKQCSPLLSSTASVTMQRTSVTHLPSTTRSPASAKLTSSTSHPTKHHTGNPVVIVLGVVTGLFLAALVVAAMLYRYKKKKWIWRRNKMDSSVPGTGSTAVTTGRSPAQGNYDDTHNTIGGPQVVFCATNPKVQALQNTGYEASPSATPEVSPSATPQQTDVKVDEFCDVTPGHRGKRRKSGEPQNNALKKDGANESLLDHSEKATCEGKGIKGAGQSTSRRHSFETFKRKVSFSLGKDDYQPVREEDPDELQVLKKDGANESLLDPSEKATDEGQGIKGAGQSTSRRHSFETFKRKVSFSLGKDDYQPVREEDPDELQGDGKVEPKSRRGSILSYISSKRKSSGPEKLQDYSSVEGEDTDQDRSRGQIKLVQQPMSQNQREGSRVEFTCECQVQGNREVSYQWLKDDAELQQQNNASLILDSVKMHDFGCYTCRISQRGGHGEAVTSEPAFLEVSPCEGKRLKYLREVELGTRDEIAKRLEIKAPGLGGYRQLADNYGMKEYDVKGLKNSPQPGQDVLEFLQGSNTELTVYSFCKRLKEDNMKRFDIVKVLENHLSIEKESK